MKLYLHKDGSVAATLSYNFYDINDREISIRFLVDACISLKFILKYIRNVYVWDDLINNELVFKVEGTSVIQILQMRDAIKDLYDLTETNIQIEIIYY